MARCLYVNQVGASEPLYEEAFGSESAVRESWSDPAAVLGLPLIASIYEFGFYHEIRWAGPELETVLHELDRLERYWHSARLPTEIAEDLRERAKHLRAAIALAKQCGGIVTIM